MSHTLQTVICFKSDLLSMGTSANKNGNYVGLLSAVLFIVAAFVMILVKDDSGLLTSTAQYVLMGAGILAVLAGILLVLKEEKPVEKLGAVLIAVLGIVALAVYFMVGSANMESQLVLEILGVIAFIAMIGSILSDRSKGMRGLMDIDIIFMLLELTFLILIFLKENVEVTGAAAVLMIGFWLASTLGLGMTASAAPAKNEIDPTRKSAKRAQKEQSKKDEEAKKKQERQEKLEAHKKAEAKKEAHEHKKEEPKPEPKKEEPKSEPKKEVKVEVKQEAPKEEKPAEPAPAEKKDEEKPNNDFMAKLVSSKDANKAAEKKEETAEPEVVEETAPVEEAAPVEEPAPVEEEPVVETAEPEEESAPVAEAAVAAAVVAAEVAEEESEEDEDSDEEEDEVLEDIFTDYSPEALVRRAAWNKGLRCRRDYGEDHIPVAFVKGKVAVYVEDPATADTSKDAKLKDEGWVILRYDINSITDGLDQGAEIAAAVKANIRAQKAAKKKKKPAKK